jgi:hypothetical protein
MTLSGMSVAVDMNVVHAHQTSLSQIPLWEIEAFMGEAFAE